MQPCHISPTSLHNFGIKGINAIVLSRLKKPQGKWTWAGGKSSKWKKENCSKFWSSLFRTFQIQYIPRTEAEFGREKYEMDPFQEEDSTDFFYCNSHRVVLREEIIQRRIKEVKENHEDTGDTNHLCTAHLGLPFTSGLSFISNLSRVCWLVG